MAAVEQKTVPAAIESVTGAWGYTLADGSVNLQFRVIERVGDHFAVQTYEWMTGGMASIEFIPFSDFVDRAKTRLFPIHEIFLRSVESRQRHEERIARRNNIRVERRRTA